MFYDVTLLLNSADILLRSSFAVLLFIQIQSSQDEWHTTECCVHQWGVGVVLCFLRRV